MTRPNRGVGDANYLRAGRFFQSVNRPIRSNTGGDLVIRFLSGCGAPGEKADGDAQGMKKKAAEGRRWRSIDTKPRRPI
jgi:hypothetical protein